MLNELFIVWHIGTKIFRQDEPPAVPVQTSPSEDEFLVAVKIFHVIIGKFCSLPQNGLPTIEDSNSTYYKSYERADISYYCRHLAWRGSYLGRHWYSPFPHILRQTTPRTIRPPPHKLNYVKIFE